MIVADDKKHWKQSLVNLPFAFNNILNFDEDDVPKGLFEISKWMNK